MAGGTGGHIFPGLALAHDLQDKGWIIDWLGTTKGLEATLVPQAGFKLHVISIEGLRGKGLVSWFKAPFKLLRALIQSLTILYQIKPRLVVGMGGFVSGPGGLAAWFLRIPLVIHEQNAIAGTTNRCLAPLACKVLEGFPHSFKARPSVFYTGNPVRKAFLSQPPPSLRFKNRTHPVKLLIVGGSRGARVLNQTMPQALQALPEKLRPLVWHQTGQGHEDSTRLAYQQAGLDARVVSFIEDMASAYAWADLVVSRAGALTIAELAAVGVGSLLVPFPFAVDDHQRYNASFLVEAGAACCIDESDLTIQNLTKRLAELWVDPKSLSIMAHAAYAASKRDALLKVVGVCEEILNVK